MDDDEDEDDETMVMSMSGRVGPKPHTRYTQVPQREMAVSELAGSEAYGASTKIKPCKQEAAAEAGRGLELSSYAMFIVLNLRLEVTIRTRSEAGVFKVRTPQGCSNGRGSSLQGMHHIACWIAYRLLQARSQGLRNRAQDK